MAAPASIPALGGRATAELIRLVGLSFSPGEVLELARSLELDVDPSDAARDLVRKATAASALPRLLEALAHARPLVEWPPLPRAPEPAGVPTAVAAPSAPSASVAADDASSSAAVRGPEVGGSDGGPGASSAGATTNGAESGATVGGATVGGATVGLGPSAFWPGTEGAAARPSERRGLDPRILVAVAGLTLVAALLAFLAGRSLESASTRSAAAPSASASARGDGALGAARPKSLSGRARLAVTRSLLHVAELCDLSPPIHDDATIFARAANDCGRGEPPTEGAPAEGATASPSAAPSGAPDASASAEATDAGAPASGANVLPGLASLPPKPRPAGGVDRPPREPTKKPPTGAGAGCVSKCTASHRACTATCGSEPQQASAYAQYQACQSRCLSAASSCKLACN